jgi:site-specific recombinase XerD
MTQIPGIFERPPGSGTYWISYADSEGKRRREKSGTKLPAALDLLAQRKKQVKRGDEIEPRQRRVWTFRRLAEEAIRHKELRLAALTIATDRIRLGQLLALIGSTRFDRLTPKKIEEVLGELKRSNRSASTVNRYRSFISSVFTYAIKTNRIAMNPVTKVGRYKENEPRVRWMRPEEEKRLRAAFVADAHEWEFDLALHTGMRRGEQFFLEWKNVDLEHGMLTVKGKTGQRHIRVDANGPAAAALRRLQQKSGEKQFVCPDNAGNIKRDWRTWFEEALKAARISDFRWHDIRHTYASRLVMAGADIRAVQELLGHKSILQTMKYSHLSPDHLKAAIAKMAVPA